MAEHESSIGASDEWYTPREYFDVLGLTFGCDPCSPGPHHWVPCLTYYTKEVDGLTQPWRGTVWLNPPFGGRHGHVPWLKRFFEHANGIALVRAYTSSDWFHDVVVPQAETLLFPRGKTKFIRGAEMQSLDRKGNVTTHPAGSVGKSPGHGVVLIGMGEVANRALARSGLGFFLMNPLRQHAARGLRRSG